MRCGQPRSAPGAGLGQPGLDWRKVVSERLPLAQEKVVYATFYIKVKFLQANPKEEIINRITA